MNRREFITLAGGAAAAAPLAAIAEQQAKLGLLETGGDTPFFTVPFTRKLAELGYVDGKNLIIERKAAEGSTERLKDFAAELVRERVDVIVTIGTPAGFAAKQATTTIPIVLGANSDPVGVGLVASLARPGGNVTGLSLQSTEAVGKRLELLRDIFPGLRRLAIIGNVGTPGVVLEMAQAQAASRALGLDVAALEIRRSEDIARGIAALEGGATAICVVTDPLVLSDRDQINALARDARLPTVYASREYVEAGGLMAYGPSWPDLFARAADYVDKILRGAKPADIPVEQPTRFELVVNLNTAKALGLTVPPSILARANEVIE
jgi:putative ABC transport system substrate-binding protein